MLFNNKSGCLNALFVGKFNLKNIKTCEINHNDLIPSYSWSFLYVSNTNYKSFSNETSYDKVA